MALIYKDLLDKKLRPSPPDHRDHIAKVKAPAKLPVAVDLKPWADEVEDQLTLNSCTANAGCSALELAYLRAGQSKDFSRLFLYWYVRLLGGITGDDGAYPRDIGKALNRYGVCLEGTWDYVTSRVNVEPDAAAQEEAKQYPTYEYARIYGLDAAQQIKNSLAQGIPVLTSMAVHNGFYYLSGDWKTHDWNDVTSQTNPVDGYHEVLIIGYDEVSQRFLAENSWGPGYGDGGFFGIPYRMIGTTVDEWWVLSRIGVDYIPVDGEVQPEPGPTPVPPAPTPPAPQPEDDDERSWLPWAIGGAIALIIVLHLAGAI